MRIEQLVKDLYHFRPVYKSDDLNIGNWIYDRLGTFFSASVINSFISVILSTNTSGYNLGGNRGLKNIKDVFNRSKNPDVKGIANGITSSFNLKNQYVKNKLSQYAAARVAQINETTRKQLRDTILAGYSEAVVLLE